MRVVSHSCSNTEILCALGCAGMLVGVDDHSDYPPAMIAGISRVGPDLHVDVDRVVALRPDLVIASLTVPGHEANADALRRAGLPVLTIEPMSLADIPRDIRVIGQALGVGDRAEALAAAMEAELAPAEVSGRRPRVLVEWWPKPVIVPGRLSWVTDMIRLAGGENPFGDRDVKSTPITDDEARAAAPDVCVASWCGVPDHKVDPRRIRRRAGWQGIPAVANGRCVAISEGYLGRPGPRIIEGIRLLRAALAGA